MSRSGLGLLALLALGCAEPVTFDGQVRGTVLTAWSPRSYKLPTVRSTLRRVRGLGADHVGVITTWYQSSPWGDDIARDPERTPMDDSLRYAIGEARDLGLRVALKPHLDLQSGQWRGDIVPADRERWFKRYSDFVLRYARIAEDEGVEVFIVGTELKGTEADPRWREVIAAVREVYSGTVVYGANWDSYANVPFWDAVDWIGVDGYFPLTGSHEPSAAALDKAWAPFVADLERLAAEEERPVVLTEVGYQDRDGTNTSPWWAPTEVADAREQELCVGAALRAISGSPGIIGALVWKTYYDPAEDLDGFDVIGKPAEAAVREAWER